MGLVASTSKVCPPKMNMGLKCMRCCASLTCTDKDAAAAVHHCVRHKHEPEVPTFGVASVLSRRHRAASSRALPGTWVAACRWPGAGVMMEQLHVGQRLQSWSQLHVQQAWLSVQADSQFECAHLCCRPIHPCA